MPWAATNPSNDILSEIGKIHDLNFDYAELGIEGPEGNLSTELTRRRMK